MAGLSPERQSTSQAAPVSTMPKDGEEPIYGGARGDGTLVPPEMIAGTFVGNGCFFSPDCVRARTPPSRLPDTCALALGTRGSPARPAWPTGLEVSPACCGGICVLKYCGGCPIPYQCQFMMNCCDKCYTDCVSRSRSDARCLILSSHTRFCTGRRGILDARPRHPRRQVRLRLRAQERR